MQRFFTGLLCFSVLMMFYGCATITDDSSVSGQKPASQTETKAAAPTPGATETQVTAPPGTTGTGITPAQDKPPAPAVEVPEKAFDFGVMREERDYSHAFIIKNVGTSELIIKKIVPG
jgi:hypothetical protein